jgi:hypothetical protein
MFAGLDKEFMLPLNIKSEKVVPLSMPLLNVEMGGKIKQLRFKKSRLDR